MTREEAKELYVKQVLDNRLGVYDCGWDTIDKIYDAFEKMLKDKLEKGIED